MYVVLFFFFFSSRRRHTRCLSDWSSDVCSSDLSSWTAPPTWATGLRRISCCPCPDRPRKAHAARHPPRDCLPRSEERRVGKECRSRWSPDHYKKKTKRIEQRPQIYQGEIT